MRIGVVVGRFQVPELHAGHRWVLDYAATHSDLVVVVLGIPAVVSPHDPLGLGDRLAAIGDHFKSRRWVLLPLQDVPGDDAAWSRTLDSLLYHSFPGGEFMLYGGRDCCLEHYTGRNPKQQIENNNLTPDGLSGTIERQRAAGGESTLDYRRGVIAATNRLWTPPFCVDIAAVYRDQVAMIRKAGETRWRFPGGHVDLSDTSLESAALRELAEETGLKWFGQPKYITSQRVLDSRWKGTGGRPLTTLFRIDFAKPLPMPLLKAGDDAVVAEWRSVTDGVVDTIHPAHDGLFALLQMDWATRV